MATSSLTEEQAPAKRPRQSDVVSLPLQMPCSHPVDPVRKLVIQLRNPPQAQPQSVAFRIPTKINADHEPNQPSVKEEIKTRSKDVNNAHTSTETAGEPAVEKRWSLRARTVSDYKAFLDADHEPKPPSVEEEIKTLSKDINNAHTSTETAGEPAVEKRRSLRARTVSDYKAFLDADHGPKPPSVEEEIRTRSKDINNAHTSTETAGEPAVEKRRSSRARTVSDYEALLLDADAPRSSSSPALPPPSAAPTSTMCTRSKNPQAKATAKKRKRVSISLTKEEIKEDLIKIFGFVPS